MAEREDGQPWTLRRAVAAGGLGRVSAYTNAAPSAIPSLKQGGWQEEEEGLRKGGAFELELERAVELADVDVRARGIGNGHGSGLLGASRVRARPFLRLLADGVHLSVRNRRGC